MYTLYKFHFLNGISEINQLFDDILIIWPAPVYIYIQVHLNKLECRGKVYFSIQLNCETRVLNKFNCTQTEVVYVFGLLIVMI